MPTGVGAAAARVLSACLGTAVALEPAGVPRDSAGRDTVHRYRLTERPTGAPATVIVKSAGEGGDRPPLGLLNEWAALELLSDLELDPPAAPELFGGDLSNRILVMEDLGDGESLSDLLLGADPGNAERAVVSLARTLGRVQAAAKDRAGAHGRRRSALGPLGGEAVMSPEDLASRFLQAMHEVGVPLGTAEQDLEHVIARITGPGAFLGFVHGDAGPGNERVVDGRVVLVDFATAGWRHALLDGVGGRLAFPSSWCARRLPEQVAERMEDAYRAELVAAYPEAADDAAFAREALTACAYWFVETVTVALSTRPFRDKTWGISTVGQRLTYRSQLFTKLAEDGGRYGALALVLHRLIVALGLENESLPLYPAFGGG